MRAALWAVVILLGTAVGAGGQERRDDGVVTTFRWGLQRPDLVRYNRVEALSVGARGQARLLTPWGPLTLNAVVRVGAGDLRPNLRGEVVRETLASRWTLSAYDELAAIDERAGHLGVGNSLTALLFGRDEGDYYRRRGAALEWTPPSAERAWFAVRAYAERQRAVRPETRFAMAHAGSDTWTFRPNLQADAGDEAGLLVRLSPWWGTDPLRARGGVEVTVHGAAGTRDYRRAEAVGRLALPLAGRFRVGLEGGAGTSWGQVPTHRLWYLGGPTTLRGHEPTVLAGTSYVRGRAELARRYAFGALSLFGDAGWAGDRRSADFDDVLMSVGAGLSLADGLIRFDLGRGLRAPGGWRADLYLDGIL